MIPAQAAVGARHLHADGWTVSAIARHLGHDRKTVRIYLAGVRDPGQPRAGTTDTFGPFDAYATRRLRQDPHLSAAALHRELLGLNYAGSYSAFTRSLRQRGLLTECPDCSNDTVPRITQRASLLNHLHRPQGLPIRVAPVFGQTIASFLDQVAVANHLPAAAVLAHLPAWFRQQYRTHDDLNPGKGPRAHRQDADALAALTRNDADALAKTLPALTGRHRDPSTPMRLTVACHRCTARRGLPAVIPVHLPALQRLCPRHRTWLGHTQQIDTTGCPDIVGAARRAARLARRHGSTRVLLAETIARQTIQQCLAHDQYPVVTQRWSVRIDRLATARTRSLSGTGPHAREDLIATATYSNTITLAASLLSPTGSTPPTTAEVDPLARLLGSLPLTTRTADWTVGSPSMTDDHQVSRHSI